MTHSSIIYRNNEFFQQQLQDIDTQKSFQLSPTFFLELHRLQTVYKLHNMTMGNTNSNSKNNSKHNQPTLAETITTLITYYTDCLNTTSDMFNVYFQLKIKDLSKEYQQLMKQISKFTLSDFLTNSKHSSSIELGALQDIDDPTNNQASHSKQELNKHVMVNLQIQDIRQHVLECNRKAEITKQKIADNLKLQQDNLQKRRTKKMTLAKSRSATYYTSSQSSTNTATPDKFKDGLETEENKFIATIRNRMLFTNQINCDSDQDEEKREIGNIENKYDKIKKSESSINIHLSNLISQQKLAHTTTLTIFQQFSNSPISIVQQDNQIPSNLKVKTSVDSLHKINQVALGDEDEDRQSMSTHQCLQHLTNQLIPSDARPI